MIKYRDRVEGGIEFFNITNSYSVRKM
jgi:hypothetical protein